MYLCTHLNMSYHMCTLTTWRSELELYEYGSGLAGVVVAAIIGLFVIKTFFFTI